MDEDALRLLGPGAGERAVEVALARFGVGPVESSLPAMVNTLDVTSRHVSGPEEPPFSDEPGIQPLDISANHEAIISSHLDGVDPNFQSPARTDSWDVQSKFDESDTRVSVGALDAFSMPRRFTEDHTSHVPSRGQPFQQATQSSAGWPVSTPHERSGFEVEIESQRTASALPSPIDSELQMIRDGAAIAGSDVPREGAIPAPAGSKKKSHARKQPAGHIPRPRNAFILFRKHITDNNLIPTTVEVKHQNISIVASKMWSEAPAEVKAEFTEAARIEKEEHARMHVHAHLRQRYVSQAEPFVSKTDIVRRRVRKDPNEDEKCDAVANLLIQGKAGEILEEEIKEQIASVSAEVQDSSAVKLVIKRGRRRRKETPGELSKGALRAQKAQARARAMRESWAESGFLIASSDPTAMEPKNRFDQEQARKMGQQGQHSRRPMEYRTGVMSIGLHDPSPGPQNALNPQQYDRAHFESHAYAGGHFDMQQHQMDSAPPTPLENQSLHFGYPEPNLHYEPNFQPPELGYYEAGPRHRYGQAVGPNQPPPVHMGTGQGDASNLYGTRAPIGYADPWNGPDGGGHPGANDPTVGGSVPPGEEARYPGLFQAALPFQVHRDDANSWAPPLRTYLEASPWAAPANRVPDDHLSAFPLQYEAEHAPAPPMLQFPVDYAPVARPADIIAGHWIQDQDHMFAQTHGDETMPVFGEAPADGIAQDDANSLIPYMEPAVHRGSNETTGAPTHGIDFGHQGELFGGELLQQKDVDLQGYEEALRHNLEPTVGRV